MYLRLSSKKPNIARSLAFNPELHLSNHAAESRQPLTTLSEQQVNIRLALNQWQVEASAYSRN